MNRRNQIILLSLLLAANLLFIWGNSMLPASASSELSGGLLTFLGGGFAEKVLRKLAHFSEFASLGLLLCLLLRTCRIRSHTAPLLLGILAALVDETIQTQVIGRSASVIDVWIDTAGVCAGIVTALIVLWLIEKCTLYFGGKTK